MKTKTEKKKVVVPPAKPWSKQRTVSSVSRELILAGKTNEQVLDALVKEFNLDLETKKSYPQWYRRQLIDRGLITKAKADACRH